MTAAPWLSVIMPTYNGARYVGHALASVLEQSPEGVEVLVVDDGSSDGTLDVVRSFESSIAVRTVLHEPGGNWVRASNAGLRAARGRYACFLHQDDMWLPGRVATLRRVMASEGNDVRLIVHPARFVGPDGERLGSWGCPLEDGLVDAQAFVERLLVQNFIAIPSPVFDTGLALRSGGLDESLWYTADWDLWLRLGAAGPVRFLGQPLAAFRVHPESQTAARRTNFEDLRLQMTTVLERHLATWPVQDRRRRSVRRAAELSVKINAALAAASRGQEGLPPWRLAAEFLALGPAGWRRYLRDSWIVARLLPRARLRMRRRS